jgi:transcriptional regulator GlxA family with amidase domain
MAGIAILADDPRLKTDQVARRLGLSPRRLRRLYETSFGVTFADYRNRVRLGRLAFLVANGDTPLQEAAVAAGFDSYAHSQQVSRMLGWMALLKQLAR